MENQPIRQGDILLIPVSALPESIKEKDSVIAYGEKTGHHHKIEKGKVYTTSSGMQYIQVEKEATLTHQEHSWLAIPKGVWEVRNQREYSPLADRQVTD